MSGARLVYVRGLTLDPPGTIVYHARGLALFPRYSADPGSKVVQYRDGEETGFTLCGRKAYETRSAEGRAWNRPSTTRHYMTSVRLDIADRIGRPCVQCSDRLRRSGRSRW